MAEMASLADVIKEARRRFAESRREVGERLSVANEAAALVYRNPELIHVLRKAAGPVRYQDIIHGIEGWLLDGPVADEPSVAEKGGG